MKILIFGKNGQVGSALVKLLSNEEIIALDKEDLDLTDLQAISEVIHTHSPDWLINASAYTAVDLAQDNEIAANAINHLAPLAMAKACYEIACPMIHYSTDYVFDGSGQTPYLESDITKPQSVYGHTKLAGERAVLSAQPNAIILRTAWVYAQQGANFVNTMLRLGSERESLNVVDDQFGSPTLASDLAAATAKIIEQTPPSQVSRYAGVYHATGSGNTSWYGFAQKIFELVGNDKIALKPVATSAYPTAAKRPQFSVLSNQKLKDTFNIALPEWEAALKQTLS